jgi:putative flavoprotein involved in K+ transport
MDSPLAGSIDETLDVLVVGGGQAGLVMGYHLKQAGLSFRILDAAAEVGDTWHKRWDSLKLFTAAQYDSLPGMAFPAPRDTYPGKEAVADFLKSYATTFDLPLVLNAKVTALRRQDLYEAETTQGAMTARNVVVATGPFQTPTIPPIANDLDPQVFQMHSIDYRRPESIPSGKVLVVGAANTGCQIALELTATHEVEISEGQHLPTISQRPMGQDVWWWASHVGLTRISSDSRIGKKLSGRDQIIGGGLRELKRHGAVVRPRVSSVSRRAITFVDGSSSEYDAILWATGFRMDHSWIEIPQVKDDRGRIQHDRGVTSSSGLYVLGQSWQHTRTSALLGWVTKDAEFLADLIIERSKSGGALPVVNV